MTPSLGRTTFQTKFFLAAFSAAVIALGVAGALFATTMRRQIDERIEATLVAEARLAADLLARGAQSRAPGRRRHRVAVVRAHRSTRAADRGGRAPVSTGRPDAAPARVRRRRAGHGRARAGRIGPGSRAAACATGA